MEQSAIVFTGRDKRKAKRLIHPVEEWVLYEIKPAG